MADLPLLAEGQLTDGEYLSALALENGWIQLQTHTKHIILQVQSANLSLSHQEKLLKVHIGCTQVSFELTTEAVADFSALLVVT